MIAGLSSFAQVHFATALPHCHRCARQALSMYTRAAQVPLTAWRVHLGHGPVLAHPAARHASRALSICLPVDRPFSRVYRAPADTIAPGPTEGRWVVLLVRGLDAFLRRCFSMFSVVPLVKTCG